jgi:hypothetical protein
MYFIVMGLCMIICILSSVAQALYLHFTSPTMLATVVLVAPLALQIISYCDMQILSIALLDFNAQKPSSFAANKMRDKRGSAAAGLTIH